MPSSITYVNNAPQARNIDVGISSPSVRVLKADGTPYASTQVSWLFPNDAGGTLPSGSFGSGSNPQNTTTDANGIATLPGLCANNNVLGGWSLKATLVAEPSVFVNIPMYNRDDATIQMGMVFIRSGNLQSKPPSTVFTNAVADIVNTQAGNMPSFAMTVRKVSPTPADFKVNGSTSTSAHTIYTDSIGRLTIPMESGATPGSVKIRISRSSLNPEGVDGHVYGTVYALTPSAIQLNAGNNQSVNVSTAFPLTMKAKVVASGGEAIAGETVTFTCAASGASAVFAGTGTNVCTAVTNASGIAESQAFTANADPGTWSCVASIASPSLSNSFTQSNIGTGDKAQDPMQYCEA